MTREEYQKTLVRMWDSLRKEYFNGDKNCKGVACEECPLYNPCQFGEDSHIYVAYDYINIVEQWGKEHPIKTNRDKFQEVFGIRPTSIGNIYPITESWLSGEYQESKVTTDTRTSDSKDFTIYA